MHIVYLGEHPEYIPELVDGCFEEWGYLHPGKNKEDMRHKFHQQTNTNCLPLTILALEGKSWLGTASLIFHDMETHLNLSPWLSSVYVPPAHRRQGIGTHILKTSLRKAKDLGCSKLYLFTPDQEKWYAKFGWKTIEKSTYLNDKVSIMEMKIS